MAKRKRRIDIEKLIKDGVGQGIGPEYKPWITIQDLPSRGRSTRLKGIKTGRQHEFLSDMERNYFYIVEDSDKIVDIREQFPLLPQEDTLIIAKELGVKHPRNPNTGEDIVMTTDFLLTLNIGGKVSYEARTIKAKDELLNKRVIEKFEIERLYWEKRGINWGIVTEEEIDKNVALNLSYLEKYQEIDNLDCFKDIDSIEIKEIVYELVRRLVDDLRPTRIICSEFDNDLCLYKGTGLSIFKYLIINKIIFVDLKEKINVNNNIKISLTEDKLKRLEAI